MIPYREVAVRQFRELGGPRRCLVLGMLGLAWVLAGGVRFGFATEGLAHAVGSNAQGQLGIGEDTWSPRPSLMSDAVQVAAGYRHSLAVKSDGTVWAWGYNMYGQLGDGTAADRTTPVQVSGLTGVVAVAAGWSHSLFIAETTADADGDGVPDGSDNCPAVANPGQEDLDTEGVGGACDNCPSVSNPDQANADGDSAGDACDGCPNDPNKLDPGACGCGVPDTDGDADGVADCMDLCRATPVGAAVNAAGCPLADLDADGDVDVNDFAMFRVCFNGSSNPPPPACGADADFDDDADVDVSDFTVFQLCFNGASRPPACEG